MSYILDALRKADAERQRGHVPDLNSPAPAMPMVAAPPGRAAATGWWGAAAVLVVLAAALGWWLRPTASAPDPVPQPPVAQAPAPTPIQTQPPPVVATPSPSPSPQAPAPAPAPTTPPPLRRPPPPAPPAPAPAPTPVPQADAVLPWARVPATLRAQLPPLSFGGSMYSSDAKARMVVISGQAVHEGGSLAGGAVVVERIGEHAAQLRFQGQRFMWPYRP